MHLGSAIHSNVVFLGHQDDTSPGGIKCHGTGFLLAHNGTGYLITVRHIAENFDRDPFVIRVDRKAGSAGLLHMDMVEWIYPDDRSIDLAIAPLHIGHLSEYKVTYLPSDWLLTPEKISEHQIDIGDVAYTVGLFHFIYGNNNNLPILFSGNISLMPPPGERFPVATPGTNRIEQVEGYLIESRAINGASGSPVFVRSSAFDKWPQVYQDESDRIGIKLQLNQLHILGLFACAWFLPPETATAQAVRSRQDSVVPVGIGVVVPAKFILNLLNRAQIGSFMPA